MLKKIIPMDHDIKNNFNIPETEFDKLEDSHVGQSLSEECKKLPQNVSRLIIWLIENHPHALLEEFLTRGFPWPADIPFEDQVFVSQDDTDGHISGFWLGVSRDNDKWLEIEMQEFNDHKRFGVSQALRFRNGMVGGTRNPRMNPALQILLFACMKDKRSTDGFILDPETGRPLGWGEMREMKIDRGEK